METFKRKKQYDSSDDKNDITQPENVTSWSQLQKIKLI